MIPQAVLAWLSDNDYGEIVKTESASGGCINNGLHLATSSTHKLFLKTNSQVPRDMFACEAAGLVELARPGGPRFPKPIIFGEQFLLMEDLESAPKVADYWETLGQQLAVLHQNTQDQFGFLQDNYIGLTLQPNPLVADGAELFAENRLGFQAGLAVRRGLLTPAEARLVSRLGERLPELIPSQPASLLHGDLWGGNMVSDADGQPALIDPAVYYGWAETDLAMTVLFGSPPDRFFRAYQETRPLPSGLWDRFPIYNLYHLLNHLNLFGRSYYGQVMTTLRRFGG